MRTSVQPGAAAPAESSWPRAWLELLVLAGLALATTWLFRTTDLDRAMAAVFYRPDAGGGDPWCFRDRFPWKALYHFGTWPALILGLAGGLGALAGTLRARFARWRLPGLFLMLTLVLGPGLFVNALFKDHWGRPRPRQITEFDGSIAYRAVLDKGTSGQGKSFPCGHSSMGYYFAALYFLWRRRHPRAAWAAVAFGVVFGTLIGVARMAAGAHFASDVLWSAFMTFFAAWLVYHAILRIPARRTAEPALPRSRLRRAVLASVYTGLGGGVVAAMLLATPVYRDVRLGVPAAPEPVTLVLQCTRSADWTLRLAPELADSLHVIGSVQGFGWPGNRIRSTLTAPPGATWHYRLEPRGLYTELGIDLEAIVSTHSVTSLVFRAPDARIAIEGDAAAVPEIRIEMPAGQITVPARFKDRLQIPAGSAVTVVTTP